MACTTLFQAKTSSLPAEVTSVVPQLAKATIALLEAVRENLRTRPAKEHCITGMRDLHRIAAVRTAAFVHAEC